VTLHGYIFRLERIALALIDAEKNNSKAKLSSTDHRMLLAMVQHEQSKLHFAGKFTK
jgi:hypothetical protein